MVASGAGKVTGAARGRRRQAPARRRPSGPLLTVTARDPFILYFGLPFFTILWFIVLFRIKTIWRTGVPYATHNPRDRLAAR